MDMTPAQILSALASLDVADIDSQIQTLKARRDRAAAEFDAEIRQLTRLRRSLFGGAAAKMTKPVGVNTELRLTDKIVAELRARGSCSVHELAEFTGSQRVAITAALTRGKNKLFISHGDGVWGLLN